ncbi:MAG: phage tail protein [bacterium]
MKFRIYGEVEDAKTGHTLTGAIVKLHLKKEELQQCKSAKNGFYELTTEIDDSRIESGQQLLITFEMEGYHRQENLVLATEGSFNLDAKLEAAPPPLPPKKPFNWLPVIIAGGAVIFLLVVVVILFLMRRCEVPVGTIVAWHKSLPGTPSLPDGWLECNGQKVTDPGSPYNGTNLPDLNSAEGYFGGRFLRGNSKSGILQEATQIYQQTSSGHDVSYKEHDGESNEERYACQFGNNCKYNRPWFKVRPVNMSVVWIMRVK